MVDLSPQTIQKLLQKQLQELTKRTFHKEDSFDYQFSGAWYP